MGKNKRQEPPASPDPQETAAAEARFNRLDTYSPSGSGTRYGFTNASGEFEAGPAPEGRQSAVQYQESPWETQIRETLEPASVSLTDRVVQDNIYGMPDAPRVQDRSDMARDLFGRTFSLMAPTIERENERLLTNLQGRGLPVGSEAFNEAYGDQLRQTQDTISRLAMDANLNAGQEQTRQFGLDQAERQGAISELVAAMGGGYNPPNSTPSGNAPGVNYSGLVQQNYQNEMNQYQQNQQNRMGAASALGGLGSMLIKSARASKNIHGFAVPRFAGRELAKLPVHVWNYKPGLEPFMDHGGAHIGPMADDFRKVTGMGRDDRIDVVDYCGVLLLALQDAMLRISQIEREFYGASIDETEEAQKADEEQRLH